MWGVNQKNVKTRMTFIDYCIFNSLEIGNISRMSFKTPAKRI